MNEVQITREEITLQTSQYELPLYIYREENTYEVGNSGKRSLDDFNFAGHDAVLRLTLTNNDEIKTINYLLFIETLKQVLYEEMEERDCIRLLGNHDIGFKLYSLLTDYHTMEDEMDIRFMLDSAVYYRYIMFGKYDAIGDSSYLDRMYNRGALEMSVIMSNIKERMKTLHIPTRVKNIIVNALDLIEKAKFTEEYPDLLNIDQDVYNHLCNIVIS
jgi:hypothetical protein